VSVFIRTVYHRARFVIEHIWLVTVGLAGMVLAISEAQHTQQR
jgi:hypothetical protein